ncbi:hypothetical protein [Rummeliibacillus pycnus]|uniref:hypothetical protein n=1 Tax=Rummeliibacillus pycnus TaxID=101070 RepID=UPI0037CA6505
MNIASLVSDRYTEIENRKRALRQKTADNAYRKNAQYFKPNFNPALEELVELLTGKKEQEHQPEVQSAIRDLKQNQEKAVKAEVESSIIVEKDVNTEKMEASSLQQAITSSHSAPHDQTIAILEDVRLTALAPENPSKQDYQVVANATETIQQAKGQSTQASEPLKVVQMNGQEKDETAKKLFLKKAISRYSFHVQMAKQGFQFAQPTIYLAV